MTLALTRNIDVCIYSNRPLSKPSKTTLNLSIRFDLSLYFAAHIRSITDTQKASTPNHTYLPQSSKHWFLQKIQNCTLLYLTFCIPTFMFIHHSSFQIAFCLISVRLCSMFGNLCNGIHTPKNDFHKIISTPGCLFLLSVSLFFLSLGCLVVY